MVRNLITVLMLLIASSGYSRAMDFGVLKPGETRIVLTGDGPIVPGDDLKLHQFVASLPARSTVVGIRLTSPGGNYVEATRLAYTIRNSHIKTAVEGNCASACFLLFVAGTEKIVFDDGKVGVHSASGPGGQETLATQGVTTLMARLFREFGVPEPIIGRMVVTPPNEIAWLSHDDILSIPGARFEAIKEASAAPSYEPGSALTPGTAPASGAVASAGNQSVPGVEQTPSFMAGKAARIRWEQWFAELGEGELHRGAEWWADHRTTAARDHVSCERNSEVSVTPGWLAACQGARDRLALSDRMRKADPLFKAGWNSL